MFEGLAGDYALTFNTVDLGRTPEPRWQSQNLRLEWKLAVPTFELCGFIA
jgi:hypothetical protein